MITENPSTQMSGLGSSFQYEESNFMIAESMEEWLIKIRVNMRQWDSWRQEGDFTMEMILTGRTRNTPHLSARLAQIISTGIPPLCT